MKEVEHLEKMANQIAANFSFHEDAVERIADHLRRFWAPSMRSMLAEYEQSGQADLEPAAREALKRL